MTNITNEDVKNAPNFCEAFNMFKSFMGNEKNILCVWGNGDLKELYRNIKYYNLSTNNLSNTYINVQHHASIYFNNPTGKSIGLQNAITLLELKISDLQYGIDRRDEALEDKDEEIINLKLKYRVASKILYFMANYNYSINELNDFFTDKELKIAKDIANEWKRLYK